MTKSKHGGSKVSDLYLRVKNKFSPMALAAVIGGTVVVGVLAVVLIKAAGTRLYLSPVKVSTTANQTFQVAIRVDTPEQINAAQATVKYSDTQLELVAISYSNTAFPLQAEETKSLGSIKLGRAIDAGTAPVTGDLLMATLTFKALIPGEYSITFGTDSVVLKADGSGTNILGSTEPAIVTATSVEGAIMSLAPSSANVAQGSVIDLQIWEDSGSEPVNAVQANIEYASTQLELVGIKYDNSAFGLQAEETKTPGLIKLGRGINAGTAPVAGNKLVATLSFKGLVATGTATVSFASGSAIVSANTNANILATTKNGNYTLTAAAADTVAPTVNITAPASGAVVSNTVTITASASDNVGVTKVEFLLNGTLIGTDTAASGGWSYAWDTTRARNAAFTITAKAYDAAGNVAISPGLEVTVSNTADAAPATPTGLAGQAVDLDGSGTKNDLILTWDANKESDLAYYTMHFCIGCGVPEPGKSYPVNSKTNSATFSNFFDGTNTWTVTVQAIDTAGNKSSVSAPIDLVADITAPSAPTNLSTQAVSSSQVNLSWSASSDNTGVTGYEVYRNNVRLTTITTTSFGDTGLSPGNTYTYYVKARDAAGNVSPASNTVSVTTPVAASDLTPPTAPANLHVTREWGSNLAMAWNGSTDNAGVLGYYVYRDGVRYATVTTTSYTDNNNSRKHTYSYYVRAFDAAGNLSATSNSINR
jgi:chitodextrinase